MQKKLIKYFILVILVILVSGCDEHDGKMCVTSDGELLKLKYNLGETYFVKKIDLEEMNKINQLRKTNESKTHTRF
jgi:hypothetical protein